MANYNNCHSHNNCEKTVCDVIDKLELQTTVILPDSSMQTTRHTAIGELVNIGDQLESVIKDGKLKVDAEITVPPVTVDMTELISAVEKGFETQKKESDETQVIIGQIKQTQDLLLTATNTIDNIVNQINTKTITEQELKSQLSTVESLLTDIKNKPSGGTGGATIDYSQKLTDIITKLTAINTDTTKLTEVSTKLTAINAELTVFKTQVDADLNLLVSQTDEIEPLLKTTNTSLSDTLAAIGKVLQVLNTQQAPHQKVDTFTGQTVESVKVAPANVITSIDIRALSAGATIVDTSVSATPIHLEIGESFNHGNGLAANDLSKIQLNGTFKITWDERGAI